MVSRPLITCFAANAASAFAWSRTKVWRRPGRFFAWNCGKEEAADEEEGRERRAGGRRWERSKKRAESGLFRLNLGRWRRKVVGRCSRLTDHYRDVVPPREDHNGWEPGQAPSIRLS
jgi:hypothetical protein